MPSEAQYGFISSFRRER